MANQARVTSVIVMSVQDDPGTSRVIELNDAIGTMEYSALFWDKDTVYNILSKYYEQNTVELTPELTDELRKCGRQPEVSGNLRPEDIRLLWDTPIEGKSTYMMAKSANCPVKVYRSS